VQNLQLFENENFQMLKQWLIENRRKFKWQSIGL
jgi:hypothetical protein